MEVPQAQPLESSGPERVAHLIMLLMVCIKRSEPPSSESERASAAESAASPLALRVVAPYPFVEDFFYHGSPLQGDSIVSGSSHVARGFLSVYTTLMQLPGAQVMTAEVATQLLLDSVKSSAPLPYKTLMQLPGIQRMTSDCWCKVARSATDMHDNQGITRSDLLEELGRFAGPAGHCQVSSVDARELIRSCIDVGSSKIFKPELGVGHHLMPEDIITLMNHIHCRWHACSTAYDMLLLLGGLTPAAEQMDLSSFTCALQAIVRSRLGLKGLSFALSSFSLATQLPACHCFSIACSCLDECHQLPSTLDSQLPGLQELDADAIASLLVKAASNGDMNAVSRLTLLPHAQDVLPFAVCEILQTLVEQPHESCTAWKDVSVLRGASNMSTSNVQHLFDLLAEVSPQTERVGHIKYLLAMQAALPLVKQMCSDISIEQLQRFCLVAGAANNGDTTSLLELLEHPRASELAIEAIGSIATRAVSHGGPVARKLAMLAHHGAVADCQLSEATVVGIINSCLGKLVGSAPKSFLQLMQTNQESIQWGSEVVQTWLDFRATSGFSVQSVKSILQVCVEKTTMAHAFMPVWPSLLALPAAQELSAVDIASLVQTGINSLPTGPYPIGRDEQQTEWASPEPCQAALMALLQLPGAKECDAAVTHQLGQLSLDKGYYDVLSAALALPDASELQLEQVRPWMQYAQQHSELQHVSDLLTTQYQELATEVEATCTAAVSGAGGVVKAALEAGAGLGSGVMAMLGTWTRAQPPHQPVEHSSAAGDSAMWAARW